MGFADSGLLHELDVDPPYVGSGTHIGRFNRWRTRRLVLQASGECPACGDPQRGLSAQSGGSSSHLLLIASAHVIALWLS